MSDFGRVTPASTAVADPEPKKNVFASAIAQERANCEAVREENVALRNLLGSVYSYCSSDIEAYGGAELLREVQAAIGVDITSDL